MKLFIRLFFLGLCTISNVLSKEDVLSEKIHQLTEMSLKKPLIRFNTERFNHFVKTAPRNYSMIVMLTALSPQRQCGVCKQAYDEFQILAQSYRYSNAFTNKLFFGMIDFDEGSEIFQYLKLNSAPAFIHFQPKLKPKKSDFMDISRGFAVDHMAKWVKDRTGVIIQIYRPPNYSRLFSIGIVLTMLAVLVYFKRNSLEFLYNYLFWGIFVILAILTFISGQMWNIIRGSPFEIFADDSNMQFVAETYIGLFSGSSGYQFGAETYVVFLLFFLHFGVSTGMILLNEAPKLRSQSGKRKAMVAILGMLMVVFLFSFILSIFRSKYQGYPYSFLIK